LVAFRDHAYDQHQYDTEEDIRTKRKFVCPPMEQLMQLEGLFLSQNVLARLALTLFGTIDLQERCEQVVRTAQTDPDACLSYTTYAQPDEGARHMYTFVRKLLRHILPASKVGHANLARACVF
jgi:hypothetical protein